jgi:hypothetical protein
VAKVAHAVGFPCDKNFVAGAFKACSAEIFASFRVGVIFQRGLCAGCNVGPPLFEIGAGNAAVAAFSQSFYLGRGSGC